MSRHLILGAGSAGRSIAEQLQAAGEEVVIASRSGRRGLDGAQRLALDVTDTAALTTAAAGMTTIINALNPPHYHRWQRDWPPMATAIRSAARATGVDVISVGNLYPYGPVTAPMTETTPEHPNGAKGQVRARMWADLLADHTAGHYRATELRSSDYTGENADSAIVNTFVVKAVAQGRRAMFPGGRADAPHSWTDMTDLGRMAVAVITQGRDDDWGRLWHVPTAPPRSLRQLADDVADLAGTAPARLIVLPALARQAMGLVAPTVWALRETAHQFETPFVIDSSAAQARFDLAPTPWEQTLRSALASVAPEVSLRPAA